jgi:ubiquinone/menaquinone biosynthesis C-methylase UbiE
MIEAYDRHRPDHVDSYLHMMTRRKISDEFAAEPVDFYFEALQWGNQYFAGSGGLTEDDVILDLGSGSGEFGLRARNQLGIRSYMVALDPDSEPYRFYMPSDLDESNFSFIQGVGEAIPLPDNSVKVVVANNVVFRLDDVCAVMSELIRVTEPGGLIMLTTNYRDHAKRRHAYVREIGEKVSQLAGLPVMRIRPPAHGYYADNFDRFIEGIQGVEIIHGHDQETSAIITRERLPDYRNAIAFTGVLLGYDRDVRKQWRDITDGMIVPRIERVIRGQEKRGERPGGFDPHFSDPIHRKLFILKNVGR